MNRSSLSSSFNSTLPDNSLGLITPAVLRSTLVSVIDSTIFPEDTGSIATTTSLPFLSNQTSGSNTIRKYQNIINHGDLVVKLNDTLIIEEGAQYSILGQLTNNGLITVSGSLIANQGITGPGSITGPGTVLNNSTVVTFDKANQAYGFPQLNNTGYSYFGFKNTAPNLLSNYTTVATRLDGQQSVYSIDTTGWDASTQYLHYYLPEGQYEGQSVELVVMGSGVNLGGGNAARIQIWIDSIRRPEYYGQLSGGPGGWQAFSDPTVFGNWRKNIPRAIWINNAWTIDNGVYWD
jgi:hypothetical protein